MAEIYKFRGRDITEKFNAMVDSVVAVLVKQLNIPEEDARQMFLDSKTFSDLENTETGFWAGTPEYIVDYYFEEIGIKN